jgi:hypothetical protein
VDSNRDLAAEALTLKANARRAKAHTRSGQSPRLTHSALSQFRSSKFSRFDCRFSFQAASLSRSWIVVITRHQDHVSPRMLFNNQDSSTATSIAMAICQHTVSRNAPASCGVPRIPNSSSSSCRSTIKRNLYSFKINR